MILIFIFLICLMIYICVFNKKISAIEDNINENIKSFDRNLKIEWELIPRLIKVLKPYYEKEKKILDELILIRNKLYDKLTFEEKKLLNEELIIKVNEISMFRKQYKELNKNEEFKSLMNEIRTVEKQLVQDLQDYNYSKSEYNQKTKFIINSWLSKLK